MVKYGVLQSAIAKIYHIKENAKIQERQGDGDKRTVPLCSPCVLYKCNQQNTNDNQYYAVKVATVHGTNNDANFKYGSSFSFNGENFTVSTTSNPDNELSNGNCCIFYIARKHFVLVYGIDSQQTGTSKYLVADPDGGKLRTLTEAMTRRNVSASMSNITAKLVVK